MIHNKNSRIYTSTNRIHSQVSFIATGPEQGWGWWNQSKMNANAILPGKC